MSCYSTGAPPLYNCLVPTLANVFSVGTIKVAMYFVLLLLLLLFFELGLQNLGCDLACRALFKQRICFLNGFIFQFHII